MHAETFARLTTRGYEDDDETAILDLFTRSFHQPRTPEHFSWKYLRNPFGSRHISLTFDDSALVGHYAGYVVPYWLDRRELLAHQIGDTMTDVSVRHVGRGPSSVLGRTALHFYQTFCERTVAFNYGFNVANIQKFSLRFLRSDRVEPVAYRCRDLRRSPIPAIARFERWSRGYQLELVDEVGDEWNRFFKRVAPAYRFLVRRDAQYVRWRYLQCPDMKYFLIAIRKWRHLAGWMAFRICDHRFVIGDALFDRRFDDALEVMLRHLVPQYPVGTIEGWFPPRPRWFDGMLRRLGLSISNEPQDLSVMCVPFELQDATAEMRRHLYYTMGDSDLF